MDVEAANGSVSVLIADDSSVMRLLVSDILSEDPELKVLGVARNGKEAAELNLKLKPQVILLDINMGEYDGIYAIKRIMKERPAPIMMLSAVGNTDFSVVMEALEQGALDYLNKPAKNSIGVRKLDHVLREKVKQVAKSGAKMIVDEHLRPNIQPHTFSKQLDYDVVAVGASTGGPTAIENLICKLPQNFAIPVLIVQHMPANFVEPFVRRLNRLSPLTVKLAEDREKLEPGVIYVSPGDKNMIVSRKQEGRVVIGFSKEQFKEYNHPSINSIMLSVAKVYGKRSIGVIMTGMGRDGARGLKAISESGGSTIAQNQESSVVFGMPKEAISLGAAEHIIDIKEMGHFIVSHLL